MRPFQCTCGARVFFENTVCLSCGHELGFVPDQGQLGTLADVAGEPGLYRTSLTADRGYRKCENATTAACNWLVPANGSETLCQACRLNGTIPDLSLPENHEPWANAESAKRRLIYALNQLGLPVASKSEDPERGLAFDIKNDTGAAHVLTGHADGLVTLNLKEADPVLREKARVAMQERYRTLLGHFRHEVGHYYWDVLLSESDALPDFRELFGDEREDYAQALTRHYAAGPRIGFEESFVSSYATAHPFEDWAETWAHYLLMVDTLDTASAYGLRSHELPGLTSPAAPFAQLIARWLPLTVALNALSRSMGQPDPYPFALGDGVREKLAFVHQTITARAVAAPPSPAL